MRYYVVPRVGDGLSTATAFRPKYTDVDSLRAGWNVGTWRGLDYGLENLCVIALDLSPADHADLAAQADVLAVPDPLTTTVTAGALATVKAKLEAANLPADWVTAGMTYRQVLAR